MKRTILCLSILSLSLFGCSSNDDESRDQSLEADFVLRIDGTTINNDDINLDVNNFNYLNNARVEITAGGNGSIHFFGFYLPFPLDEGTFIMVEGSSLSENTAFYTRNGSEVYYTTSGIVTINEVIHGSCDSFRGTLDIDLAYTSDTSRTVNIRGDFEITDPECE